MKITDSINEGSDFDLEVSFLDDAGLSEIPNALRYKVTDLASGTQVRALTDLTPAETVTVRITHDDTAILNAIGDDEIRVVSFVATFGSRQVTGEKKFKVINLSGLSSTDLD